MISSLLSRASATLLIIGGLALLFASDAILPQVVENYPADGAWIGQLLGASWLAVGALNWLSRSALLGGIYGRPVVLPNLAIYFIGTMVLLRVAISRPAPTAIWIAFGTFGFFALIYAVFLLRGPLRRDFELNRGT